MNRFKPKAAVNAQKHTSRHLQTPRPTLMHWIEMLDWAAIRGKLPQKLQSTLTASASLRS